MADAVLPRADLPRFGIGKVLGQSFTVFFRNFHRFFPIMLLCSAPSLALTHWTRSLPADPRHPLASHPWLSIVAWLVAVVVTAVSHGIVTVGTVQQLGGERFDLRVCLQRGLAAAPKVAVATFLFWLAILLGMVVIIIPGLVVVVIFWVYLPTIVVENVGILESFRRSRLLTRGRRWPIFGLFLVVIGAYVVLEVVLIRTVGLAGLQAAMRNFWILVAAGAFGSVIGTYYAVVTALGYYHLRAEKEGITSEIAKVFD